MKQRQYKTKKQMDVLIRNWNESEGLIVTQYLMSFFFGRATWYYIVDLFLQLQEDENKQKYPLLWNALPTCHLMALILTVCTDMAVIEYQVEQNGTQWLVTIHKLYNACCT